MKTKENTSSRVWWIVLAGKFYFDNQKYKLQLDGMMEEKV
jgi:hypothetical protein